MSWRETLGVASSIGSLYTHNPHNSQNPHTTVNCADIADSAHSDSKDENSRLLETLANECQGFSIFPNDVRKALSAEDIDDWHNGNISDETFRAVARSLEQRQIMDRGEIPESFTQPANCKHCGPVWLWFSGDVLGCPWCWNRISGLSIPRPKPVHCIDCKFFSSVDHRHHGHCDSGQPEAPTGLWDTDPRYCEQFLFANEISTLSPSRTHKGPIKQPTPINYEVRHNET